MSTHATAPDASAELDCAAHEQPSGSALNRLALSATVHCLTGCAIGEVSGMAIGTALGWGNLATIALAVGLAYLFGFGLTSVPLFRAGLSFAAIVPIAIAADSVSITIMEAIDNLFVAVVPGAMETGLDDPLLWGSIAGGFAIAFPFAWVANRYMIARGKGCAIAHQHH
jgi:hypothetical protein